MNAIAVLCQAALEQAVLAAEGPPHGLATDDAYAAVTEEMIRQCVLAAIEADVSPDRLMRCVAEALVVAKRARKMA